MAISAPSNVAQGQDATADPHELSFGSDVTSGNLLVAVIGFASANTLSSITDSQSNTWTIVFAQAGTAGVELAVGWAIAGSTGACDVDFNGMTSGTSRMRLFEIAAGNGWPADPVVGSASQADTTKNYTSGTVAAAESTEVIFVGSIYLSNKTPTEQAGWTTLGTVEGFSWASYHIETDGTLTDESEWSNTGPAASDGAVGTVVFKEDAAGGGATPHGPLGLALHGPFGGPFG